MGRPLVLFILGAIQFVGMGCTTGPSAQAVSARWIAEHGGEVQSGGTSSRVDTIADRYSALLQRPIHAHVLQNDVPMAWGWPSGDIYVTRGLESRVSEDELAAVVGHEIGHLLQGGHIQSTVAVLGRSPADQDLEIDADARCLVLLDRIGVPRSAMRTSLEKVCNAQPADARCRVQLARRIELLP